MLNKFRTLIHPSSGACDFSVVSPHWLCVLVSMCVGVSVWLGWSGKCVAGSYFDVCWSFGVAALGWYPCSRLLFRCVLEFRCGLVGVVYV